MHATCSDTCPRRAVVRSRHITGLGLPVNERKQFIPAARKRAINRVVEDERLVCVYAFASGKFTDDVRRLGSHSSVGVCRIVLHLVTLPDTTVLLHRISTFSVSSPLTWMFSHWHRANLNSLLGTRLIDVVLIIMDKPGISCSDKLRKEVVPRVIRMFFFRVGCESWMTATSRLARRQVDNMCLLCLIQTLLSIHLKNGSRCPLTNKKGLTTSIVDSSFLSSAPSPSYPSSPHGSNNYVGDEVERVCRASNFPNLSTPQLQVEYRCLGVAPFHMI